MFGWIEHLVFTFVVAIVTSIYFRKGKDELLRMLVIVLKQLPGVEAMISSYLQREVSSFIQTTSLASKQSNKESLKIVIPKRGISNEELKDKINTMLKSETKNEEGRIFAYTYTLEDDHFEMQKDVFKTFEEKAGYSMEHDQVVSECFQAFMHENALNPMVYPSLRKMETEIVKMTGAMLNGDSDVVGFLTSGGTESNLMAVKAYRDRAKKLYPQITEPEIVAPITIHPTIDKAAHYFGLKAITPNTVLLAASAPQFCHGILDPIGQISQIALRKGLPFHVDACFGGFMVEKLGYEVPPFDFRNPGVTSMSADIHKYGYSAKGASVILYKNSEYRKYQIYTYSEWPGGGNIGAAWAAMQFLGEEGYMKKAQELMDTTKKLIEGITKIPGIKILGNPCMTAFAIGSNDPDVDIQVLADLMDKKGWKMERNIKPDSIHCSILPHHIPYGNKSLSGKGTAGVYGMVSTVPDKSIINDFLVEFFSEVYK
ncbi:hypothetical protein KUTeg_000047 [Tegillarca granosa]|uniref:Sphingosine-1-phosphate lyase n=1 Tax=Tegillarca granosa TaxID=220873 RepID=A0ABQ9FZS0_TEGGR|nr:hypothetical protein KUTeg_000047 [Tegillarca granosa]